MEANEPPLDTRRTRLSLQYGVKLMSDKASIFTAELEAIVSALRYIKITTKTINLLFLVTLNLRCRPCCPSGITPQFRLL